ncbi:MAG: hypothetical protein ACREQ8_04405 [Woeseiaceae bacterium]
MKNKAPVATALALTLVLGAIGNPAYADLRISEFEGHIVFCAPQNPPVIVEELPGGVEIVTFVNIGNIWLTGNPLVDGIEENRAVVTFVPDSPITTVKIKGKIDVAAVDGRWRFRQRIILGPDGDSGIGLGLGSGDLRGKLLLFQTGTPELIENSPCEVPIGAPLTGKIISFGWIA